MIKHNKFILGPGGVTIGGGSGFIKPSGGGAVVGGLQNTVALEGYAPKMNYYANATPANGVINLSTNQILFNPGFPIQIYKTQSIQSTVVHTTLISAGKLLIGLYKYDYPNELFTLVAEWLGPIASGFPKYTLASPVNLTPGTYFTGYVVYSGSVRGTYANNYQLNNEYIVPDQNYESSTSYVNRMERNLSVFPITTMPTVILQSEMVISSSSTPILPPTIIFE